MQNQSTNPLNEVMFCLHESRGIKGMANGRSRFVTSVASCLDHDVEPEMAKLMIVVTEVEKNE